MTTRTHMLISAKTASSDAIAADVGTRSGVDGGLGTVNDWRRPGSRFDKIGAWLLALWLPAIVLCAIFVHGEARYLAGFGLVLGAWALLRW